MSSIYAAAKARDVSRRRFDRLMRLCHGEVIDGDLFVSSCENSCDCVASYFRFSRRKVLNFVVTSAEEGDVNKWLGDDVPVPAGIESMGD